MHAFTHFSVSTLAGLLVLMSSLSAQVPHLIHYQGRIQVETVNFEGTGQFKFAMVSADGDTTYWSNDGSSTDGGEPTAAVELPVSKGLYSVLLGDVTRPNMTAVPGSVFSAGDVHLRVWFNDGVNGFHHLAPDQRIAAVGYALMAANVADGAITSAKIAPGAVGAAQLAPQAVVDHLSADGSSVVPRGGMILSPTVDPALEAAGYVRTGLTLPRPAWRPLEDLLDQRQEISSAVWSGQELLVWSGIGLEEGDYLQRGERYNPATNTWTTMATEGSPPASWGTTAYWTGSRLLVWGGFDWYLNEPVESGGLYDPEADTWQAMTDEGAPSYRLYGVSVWTGEELIIWGGADAFDLPNDTGARYNPETDAWSAMSADGALDWHYGHEFPCQAVWTGTEMIVWGPVDFDSGTGLAIYGGAKYSPATNTWSPISSVDAPQVGATEYSPHDGMFAFWTGSEMLVWYASGHGGGRYNPSTDSWQPMSEENAPLMGPGMRSVWTGSEVIVWGGKLQMDNQSTNLGAIYDPATDTWTQIRSTQETPAPFDFGHQAVWTGSELMVLGGYALNEQSYQPPYAYRPKSPTLYHLYQRP